VRRPAPRRLSAALEEVAAELAPGTTLSRVQGAWRGSVGDVVAAETEPESERDGVVTVRCSSAVWASELELLRADLLERLNRALGASGGAPVVRSLRFRTASGRRPARAL